MYIRKHFHTHTHTCTRTLPAVRNPVTKEPVSVCALCLRLLPSVCSLANNFACIKRVRILLYIYMYNTHSHTHMYIRRWYSETRIYIRSFQAAIERGTTGRKSKNAHPSTRKKIWGQLTVYIIILWLIFGIGMLYINPPRRTQKLYRLAVIQLIYL